MIQFERMPVFFFFNDTATTEIYTLSLHDALPICCCPSGCSRWEPRGAGPPRPSRRRGTGSPGGSARRRRRPGRRSEEHTSELQSRQYLVCRLLLEKKTYHPHTFLVTSPIPPHSSP